MRNHTEDYEAASEGGEDTDEQYYDSYSDISVHRLMLSDAPRMNFYRQAIFGCGGDGSPVAGKVVVDVGSGTGILSCWAAQAGAAHVVSIEASSLADVQSAVLRQNGLADRVTVLAATVESLAAAGAERFIADHGFLRELGGVDVVVSEWMGFYLLHEGMLASVLRARDFFAAVNAALRSPKELDMIPSAASITAAPISLGALREEKGAFWRAVGGVDMGVLGLLEWEATVESASPLVEVMPPGSLLHRGACFWSADLRTLAVEELCEISATRRFDFAACDTARAAMERDGALRVDGFCVWFAVEAGGAVLDTSPLAPQTHWKQTSILLPREAREANLVTLTSLDEELGLCLTMRAEEANPRCYTLEIELA